MTFSSDSGFAPVSPMIHHSSATGWNSMIKHDYFGHILVEKTHIYSNFPLAHDTAEHSIVFKWNVVRKKINKIYTYIHLKYCIIFQSL